MSVSMKNIRYQVYVSLCQVSGTYFMEKVICKTEYGGCSKYVDAALYQLVKYWQLDIKVVTDVRTCTDILQK